jgi:hypothetical protein
MQRQTIFVVAISMSLAVLVGCGGGSASQETISIDSSSNYRTRQSVHSAERLAEEARALSNYSSARKDPALQSDSNSASANRLLSQGYESTEKTGALEMAGKSALTAFAVAVLTGGIKIGNIPALFPQYAKNKPDEPSTDPGADPAADQDSTDSSEASASENETSDRGSVVEVSNQNDGRSRVMIYQSGVLVHDCTLEAGESFEEQLEAMLREAEGGVPTDSQGGNQ